MFRTVFLNSFFGSVIFSCVAYSVATMGAPLSENTEKKDGSTRLAVNTEKFSSWELIDYKIPSNLRAGISKSFEEIVAMSPTATEDEYASFLNECYWTNKREMESDDYDFFSSHFVDIFFANRFAKKLDRIVAKKDVGALKKLIGDNLQWGIRASKIEDLPWDSFMIPIDLPREPICSHFRGELFSYDHGKFYFYSSEYGPDYMKIYSAPAAKDIEEWDNVSWIIDKSNVKQDCLAEVFASFDNIEALDEAFKRLPDEKPTRYDSLEIFDEPGKYLTDLARFNMTVPKSMTQRDYEVPEYASITYPYPQCNSRNPDGPWEGENGNVEFVANLSPDICEIYLPMFANYCISAKVAVGSFGRQTVYYLYAHLHDPNGTEQEFITLLKLVGGQNTTRRWLEVNQRFVK